MNKMISGLQAAGATVVVINENLYNTTTLMRLDVQTSEMREGMNSYLGASTHDSSNPSSLEALFDSKKFMVIPSQYNYIKTVLVSSTSNSSYPQKKAGIQNLVTALMATFTTNNLAALVYPEQKNLVVKIGHPSQSGRNGILAALTGFPVVTVPAGFSPSSNDAPIGVPVGMEILGLPWTESKLLNIAAHISDNMDIRQMPAYANASVDMKTYLTVPSMASRTVDVPDSYPIGVL
jgi:Asp-tRNA(Asn)/Glu-tRNA(Gln) amidotransferase A subunit family amidase